MTQPDLDAIRVRLAEATRGPWVLDDYDESERAWIVMNSEHGTHQHAVAAVPSIYNRSKAAANAALIAHAPTDIEALLAEVDRLRGIEAAPVEAAYAVDSDGDRWRRNSEDLGLWHFEGEICRSTGGLIAEYGPVRGWYGVDQEEILPGGDQR